MEVTRKGFIKILLTFSSAAAFGSTATALVGCGDDTSGEGGSGSTGTTTATGSTGTGSGLECGAKGTEIVGNHGHVLVIPAADLDSTTDKTYSIKGTALHDHMVTFTAANLASLKAKMPASATSTTTDVHSHVVNATCA